MAPAAGAAADEVGIVELPDHRIGLDIAVVVVELPGAGVFGLVERGADQPAGILVSLTAAVFTT